MQPADLRKSYRKGMPMNKNKVRKQLLAPIKNINRVLLISIVLFLITGGVVGAALSHVSSNNKLSICILEIATYAALGLPIVIFSRLDLKGSKDIILPRFNRKTIRNGIICAIVAYPLMLTTTYLTKITEIDSEMTSEQIEASMLGFSFLGNVIRMALVPAIVEELVFRSGLFGIYSKKNVLVGIFLSSIIFALLHCNLYQIPYALIGGIVFAYATHITNNAGTAVAAHFIINLISIITSYANDFLDRLCPNNVDSINAITTGLFMAGGVLMAGYLISKVLRKQITLRSLRRKENDIELNGFVTISLSFVISILLLLTFLYEGYKGVSV